MASVEIEFVKQTQVNKAIVKKGEKLKFAPSVAQEFIDSGAAKIANKKTK